MPVRVGLIGPGQIAEKAYFPALAGLETVELAVVLGRREDQVDRVCRNHRIASGTTDRSEFLRSGLDAAIVLTPSPTHYEIVKWLLEAGLDVLVEKPATLSSRETAALGKLSARLGRILMVAFNRRFAPFHERAKKLFGSRTVALCVAEKHREQAVNASLFDHYSEEAIHLIDLLRWYGGEARAISTKSRMRDGKLVDAASLIAFESGGLGVLAASLEAGGWLERMTVHGENLTAQVDAFRELRIIQGDEDRVYGREIAGHWLAGPEVRGFPQMIDQFVECVKTRAAPLTSAEEAFKTQLLLEDMVAKAA